MRSAWRGFGVRGCLGAVVVLAACRGALVEPVEGPVTAETGDPPLPKLVPPIIGGSDAVRQQVIRFFAPVIYQDIEDHSEQDLLTRITFDGNWRGTDNWENTYLYPKRAYVYTSLIEDTNRYFLHYGLFWPRDWCSVTCTLGQDFHENDMEGLTLVVDKRFIASGWPYGQVITMDTRSHNGISRYRNCDLAGGYPTYVTLRNGGTPPCMPFTSAYGATTPAPRRAAVFVNAQSHAVRAYSAGDYPFAGGDGVIYFPTDGAAQVPASTSTITQAGYRIQWMDSTETNAWTLWSQRRNAIVGTENTLFEYGGGLVGPHDVYYQKFFGCNDNCPSIFSTRAKAPWGIAASGSERVGDWHNHPAYAWARQYAPSGTGGGYFNYTCLTESCRTQNGYVHNIYWSDAPWASGGSSGGGGPTCGSCPKTTAGADVKGRGAEQRWDFDQLGDVSLSGDAWFSVVQQVDEDWGYAGGRANALRIQGRGEVSLSFETLVDPQVIDRVVVRARRVKGTPIGVIARWEHADPGAQGDDQESPLEQQYVSGRKWEMLQLDLIRNTAWKRLTKVKRFTLVFSLDGGPADTIDLDFVILAP
ncbi:MAG TPA: hypothetical protein VGA78_06970 [Gemmatimonadales bacterium]